MGKSKGKGKGGGGGGDGMMAKDEQALQAVLLADSFEQTFRPISLEKPKVLLPLANVPLIEYTLEFLAEAGVKEVFVFCGSLGDKVEEYLEQSRWKDSEDPVIRVMRVAAATNACHAIRELDAMDVLRSDPFVLVSGDVVSNVRLKPVLDAHVARRKSKDGGRNNIMTMVFNRVDGARNRIRPLDEELVVALNGRTNQILKYENNLTRAKVQVADGTLFDEHPTVEFRTDLIDCSIDICSQEMVNLIAENYDYMDLRSDFVRNEVQNRELDYRIHAHVLTSPSDYACRVRDLRTYAAISRDVVRRWLYPLVPDANWVTEATSYSFERGFRYRDEGVRVERNGVISEGTMLGAGVVVESGAQVINSVVGPHCVIGKGAVVRNSNLWAGVVVGANAKVTEALLCDGVVIGNGAEVSRGGVLSFGVEIAPGFTTTPFARLTTSRDQGDAEEDDDSDFGDFSDDDQAEVPSGSANKGDAVGNRLRIASGTSEATLPRDDSQVGPGGVGIRWLPVASQLGRMLATSAWAKDTFEVMSEEDPELSFAQASGAMGSIELEKARADVYHAFGELSLEEEDEVEAEDDAGAGRSGRQADDARLLQFVVELAQGSGAENEQDRVMLELNGQKFAMNRSFEDLIYALVPSILGEVAETAVSAEAAKIKLCAQLDKWTSTLERLCLDQPQEVALVTAVEVLALYGQKEAGFAGLALHARTFEPSQHEISQLTDYARAAFPFVLSHLCIKGLVSTEALQQWVDTHASLQLPSTVFASPVTTLVIQQMLEDEEDSGSEGSGSEEGSEEEYDE